MKELHIYVTHPKNIPVVNVKYQHFPLTKEEGGG